MNPNSQSANVPEFLCRVAEDQALSPGSGAIFNTKVNLRAATATSRRVETQELMDPYSCELAFGNPPLLRMMSQSASAAAREPRRSPKLQWEALRREA